MNHKMPFIAVDPSEIVKPYGKDFDYLSIIRDASDPSKRLRPGFSIVQIEAVDHEHQNLPLWQETYSTEHPDYKNLYDFVGRAMLKVVFKTGLNATWLFDRGFDGGEFYWDSIRRLTFFSMLACGIQALWLLTKPAMAKRIIARVKVFIKNVPFKNYRLWNGVQNALQIGA